MTINQAQDEIIEEFEFFPGQEMYEHIIELGKSLPGLPASEQTDENKVRGCQSSVWLVSKLNEDGTITFRGDSDALIVKGLVALVLRVFSGHTPDEILNADLHFIDKIGLRNMLSPTRSNGLAAMIKQIKFYALAYKTKLEKH
jgi:cysteine desulfuration protein SufE